MKKFLILVIATSVALSGNVFAQSKVRDVLSLHGSGNGVGPQMACGAEFQAMQIAAVTMRNVCMGGGSAACATATGNWMQASTNYQNCLNTKGTPPGGR